MRRRLPCISWCLAAGYEVLALLSVSIAILLVEEAEWDVFGLILEEMASAEFVFLRGFDLILRLWCKLLLYLALLGRLLVLLHIVVDGLEVSLLERPGRAVGAAAHHSIH